MLFLLLFYNILSCGQSGIVMPCNSIGKYNPDGVVVTDLELAFEIPENPVFAYSEATGELTVYTTDGQEAGTVPMPKNEGKTVFPVVVKDRDGNLYKIEDESGTPPATTGGGTKEIDGNLPRQANRPAAETGQYQHCRQHGGRIVASGR